MGSREAGEFASIFVLKVTLQSVRLLLTVNYRKIGGGGCTSCSPNNFIGGAVGSNCSPGSSGSRAYRTIKGKLS